MSTDFGDAAAGVSITRDGAVLRVELCRPEIRNAQTPSLWRALSKIPEFVESFDCAAVVVTGQGESFSAGLDRRMFTPEGIPGEVSLLELAQAPDDEIDAFIRQAQAGFTWPRHIDQPVIAYVQGHAVGAGCQLALAADMTVFAPDAQLALKESTWGLIPDLGVTGPLVAAVGYQRAFEICATARWVDATEAVGLGLGVAVIPAEQWKGHQDDLLGVLGALPPGTVGDLKSVLRDAQSGDEQLSRERRTQIRRLRSLSESMGR